MIWDLHCHFGGVEGATPEEKMARLVEYADRMGVDKMCVYMGSTLLMEPTPEQLRLQNDEALQAIAHWHDRAFGFAYVSGQHVEASLKEIDRCIRNGPMVGIKLWVAKRCSDRAIDPIIAAAAELKAVIFQHTWFKTNGANFPGESTPDDMVELATRFPETPLICGHTGGAWELGIRAIRESKNVYADLAGSDPTAGMVEMAIRELGAERILYGSDVSGRSFASQLAKVQGADVPEAAKKLILGENLQRLLTPILRDKGFAA